MRHILLATLALATTCAGAATGGTVCAEGESPGACASCPGPDGNSIKPERPELAGQHAVYRLDQRTAFEAGARRSDLMPRQTARLSEQDMRGLAAYVQAQVVR